MKIFALLFCFIVTAHAHVVEQLYADYSQSGDQWELKIRFDAGLALPEMRQDEKTPQPQRSWLLERSSAELSRIHSETQDYLKSYLSLEWQTGKHTTPLSYSCTLPAWDQNPPKFDSQFTDKGFAYFDVILTGKLPPETGELHLTLEDGDHPDLAIGFSNEQILTAYPGKRLQIAKSDASLPTKSDSFFSFLDYGFRHVIPDGLDHVLFILALTCLSFAWRPLLMQSLIFTLGHSITLALAVTGVIHDLPPNVMQWIEALIAATILYIALQNLFAKNVSPHRYLTIFVFGLVHGLGFASVLGDKIRASSELTLPLIAANLGVELGQIAVIGITLLCLFWARNKSYFGLILKTISALIALTASYWVIERTMLG